jgi:hypothetical protein
MTAISAVERAAMLILRVLVAVMTISGANTALAGAASCGKVVYTRTDAQERCPRTLHTADFERGINVCMDAAQDADAFAKRVVCNPQQYYAVQLDIAHWLLDAAYAARELGATARAARYVAKARALILGVKNNRWASAEVRKIAAFDLRGINDQPLDVRF